MAQPIYVYGVAINVAVYMHIIYYGVSANVSINVHNWRSRAIVNVRTWRSRPAAVVTYSFSGMKTAVYVHPWRSRKRSRLRRMV